MFHMRRSLNALCMYIYLFCLKFLTVLTNRFRLNTRRLLKRGYELQYDRYLVARVPVSYSNTVIYIRFTLVVFVPGLGWLMVLVSGIVSWYYNTIIAWVLFYLVNAFMPTLPWATCDNHWNTKFCRPSDPAAYTALQQQYGIHNLNSTSPNYTMLLDVDVIAAEQRNISSAKEFWQ